MEKQIKELEKQVKDLEANLSKEIDKKIELSKQLDVANKNIDELRKELEISSKPKPKVKQPNFKRMV